MEGHQRPERSRREMGLRLAEREGGAIVRRTRIHCRDVSRDRAGGVSGGGNGFGKSLRACALAATEFEDAGARADSRSPGVDEVDAVNRLAEFDG